MDELLSHKAQVYRLYHIFDIYQVVPKSELYMIHLFMMFKYCLFVCLFVVYFGVHGRIC